MNTLSISTLPLAVPVAKDIADSYLETLFGDYVLVESISDVTCVPTRADPSERAWEFSFVAGMTSHTPLLKLISKVNENLALTVDAGLFSDIRSNVFLKDLAERVVMQFFKTDPAGEILSEMSVLVTEDKEVHSVVFFGSKIPISKRLDWDSQTIDLIADREAGHAEF